MRRDLVIYGGGGLGREMLALVRAIDPQGTAWKFLGFVDDGRAPGTSTGGAEVLGGAEWLFSRSHPAAILMGMADPAAKASLYARLSPDPRFSFPVFVHPLACVDPTTSFADGAVVTAFCFVSVDSSLGVCSFLNVASQVGHDSVVGDFCSVMPDASVAGNVTVGARAFVGAGARILQGLDIGPDSVVGIGAVVLTNVPAACTVIGNPARVVKK